MGWNGVLGFAGSEYCACVCVGLRGGHPTGILIPLNGKGSELILIFELGFGLEPGHEA